MVEGPKFTGLIGGTNNNYYDFTQGFYQKLGEGTNMSMTVYRRPPWSEACEPPQLLCLRGAECVSSGKVGHALNGDALAQALMDSSFCSRSFWEVYRGTYTGDNVAIKILERPENSPEKAQVMEQQFQQELMMLAILKHPNIVRFIGACRKPMDLKSDNLLIASDKSIKIADLVLHVLRCTEGMTPETGTYVGWLRTDFMTV
ncbi:hypothetical protein F3Y22_tig00110597pilonHSYRG00234 [Hibiscus syriacus]|uniref:Protein kinase domain-containing protein n=1 Tax=Hibiscus syriacus TaxID=106335 RepID=A0A6A3A330_HIBSY|nr:hypothetical protein F3Y22_tig00110597pilonHSYRG00234 [Hibiscus syriacus]